jgi:hypothetical protein
MAKARQHHFLQARYLDGFLAPGSTQLVCYGRGRSKFHRSIPDGVATQRDFYAIPSRPPGTSRHSSKTKSKHQDSKHYVGSSGTGFHHLSKIASALADTSRFKRRESPIPEN